MSGLRNYLWSYEIKIADELSEHDSRPFPTVEQCQTVLNVCFPELPKAKPGVWLPIVLNNEQIVKFHHVRRELGCCPRIKWRVLGGPGECQCQQS